MNSRSYKIISFIIIIIICVVVFLGRYFINSIIYFWRFLSSNSPSVGLLANVSVIVGVPFTIGAWLWFRIKRRGLRVFLNQCDKITGSIMNGWTRHNVNERDLKKMKDEFDQLLLLANSIKVRKESDVMTLREKNLMEQLHDTYDKKIEKRISLAREFSYLRELQERFYSEKVEKEKAIDEARLILREDRDGLKSQEKDWQWIADENLREQVSVSLFWIEEYLMNVNGCIDEIRVKVLERMSYM